MITIIITIITIIITIIIIKHCLVLLGVGDVEQQRKGVWTRQHIIVQKPHISRCCLQCRLPI